MQAELEQALATLDLGAGDAAAVALARLLAAEIDSDEADVEKLSPRLLAVLDALGLTPKARAALTKRGGSDDKPASDPLDELRQRRSARQRDTAAVDTTAP